MSMFNQFFGPQYTAAEGWGEYPSSVGGLEKAAAHEWGHNGHAMPSHWRHTPALAGAWSSGYRQFEQSGPPSQQIITD